MNELQKTFSLIFSLGPTDNRRHTIAARKRILIDTEEYRDWKNVAIREIKAQLPKGWVALAGDEHDQIPYRVSMILPNRRTDVANYTKGIQDVLTHAGVWEDDKWACPQFWPAGINPAKPCIIVTLPTTRTTRDLMWPRPLA